MTALSPISLQANGRRILVIDDDLAIRVLLDAVLQRVGFAVSLAEDGQAGINLLAEGPAYDLILLDLMMPRLNGHEFLRRLPHLALEKRPHVIVFTAAGQRGVAKIPENAICGSILKPFDLESFLQLIGECIDGHPLAPAGSDSSTLLA